MSDLPTVQDVLEHDWPLALAPDYEGSCPCCGFYGDRFTVNVHCWRTSNEGCSCQFSGIHIEGNLTIAELTRMAVHIRDHNGWTDSCDWGFVLSTTNEVQEDQNMSNDYDNRGQVSLWKPDSTNEKAPAAKGTVVAHRDIKEGETVEIALWRNDSENPRAPLMKGKISDKQQPQGGGPAPSGGEDDSDGIPFAPLPWSVT